MNYQSRVGIEYKTKPNKELISNVCKHFEISPAQLKGRSRLRKFMEAREILSYLFIKHQKITSIEAGRLLNRSHCNTLHHSNKVMWQIEFNQEYKELVNSFI